MKQIIFVPILILAVCLVAIGQSQENLCPKINIKAPETVRPDETFTAFASFEKENQPATSKFNWTIIKEDEVFKVRESKIIDLDSKDLIKGGTITLLAESLNKQCPNPAMAKVFVVPNIGSPYIIDEYSELSWNDERARLENIVNRMQEFNDAELFAFFYFDKKTSQTERKNYLLKVLNELSVVQKLKKTRITFFISEQDAKRIQFQPVPKDYTGYYFVYDDYLVIKAEDFEKFDNLFRPKPINRKRKK